MAYQARCLTIIFILAGLAACQGSNDSAAPAANGTSMSKESPASNSRPDKTTHNTLADILAARPDDIKARYPYRHPQETIEFFEIEPGMTVVETLPGGGWYTQVLLPYLGSEGHLIGADYAYEMWPLFGFFPEEFIAAKTTWTTDWLVEAEAWRDADSATLGAFVMGSMPPEIASTADRVFIVRTLHNLARFESKGGFLTAAIKDAYDALKPGGIAGVVQHEAREDKSDDWADGSRGYLKKAFVIAQMEKAGFQFVGESPINQNPEDQPGDDDIVWRLPPNYTTSKDNAELQAQMGAIGESNRMTLKFRKPE